MERGDECVGENTRRSGERHEKQPTGTPDVYDPASDQHGQEGDEFVAPGWRLEEGWPARRREDRVTARPQPPEKEPKLRAGTEGRRSEWDTQDETRVGRFRESSGPPHPDGVDHQAGRKLKPGNEDKPGPCH